MWFSWVALDQIPRKEPLWEPCQEPPTLPRGSSEPRLSSLVLQLCLCLIMCLSLQTLRSLPHTSLFTADVSGNHRTPGCTRLGSPSPLCSPCTGIVRLSCAREDAALGCLLSPSASSSFSYFSCSDSSQALPRSSNCAMSLSVET